MVDLARTNQGKGRALEKLVAYLARALPGVVVEGTNIRTDCEELDQVWSNSRACQALAPWDFVILVECKNWSVPLQARDVAWFISELRRRGLTNGILVAMNGITGDEMSNAGRLVFEALRERIRIVVLTRTELVSISDGYSLVKLLKAKYCKLFVGQAL